MKTILNSGTLAIMIFGIGPFALLLWSFGMDGEIVLGLWVVSGILTKVFIVNRRK
ncbi:putative membrane protein YphA (DoxX/SURF4 family) [Arcicella rosea]